jgi:hypothetical protein
MEVATMTTDATNPAKAVDIHCHVGLLGDEHPEWGRMSEWYRKQAVYKVFTFYAHMPPDQVSDRSLRESTLEAISSSALGGVVCLALDPVYDSKGQRREDLSHMWVDNEYVVDLRKSLPDKILLGASVHPYDPLFRARVQQVVDQGAVLLKWLPSAQQIELADPRVRDAITFLATARHGAPLPLLLHVGAEYAIPSTNPQTTSYDFLSWDAWDQFWNALRLRNRWYRPQARKRRATLQAGLESGAVVIFAHLGLPYYAPHWLKGILEHSDFRVVTHFLHSYPADSPAGGRCYADVSATVTPFRRSYFGDIARLPPRSLLFGSDFPTPVFELSADTGEMMRDLKSVLQGKLDRIVVPDGNLLDANYRELQNVFPGHAMFTNFAALL